MAAWTAAAQVCPLGVRRKPLGDPRRGGLQAREREVAVPFRPSSMRGRVNRAASPSCASALQRRTAGIGQAQGLGDLVEGLAGRVVDGRAQTPAGPDALHRQKLAMAAADQQQQEGIGHRRRQPGRDGMALQMVDGHQRQAARASATALPKLQAHHHSRPPGPARRGGGDTGPGHRSPRRPHGQGCRGDAVDAFDVCARRDLRHHPAEGRMGRDLAGDHGGQHLHGAVGAQAHDRRRGLVAAGLQAEHQLGLA